LEFGIWHLEFYSRDWIAFSPASGGLESGLWGGFTKKAIPLLAQGVAFSFAPKLRRAWLFRKEKATN